jgi:hypothetical protein
MSIFSLTCPDVGCYQNFLCDPEFQNKIIAVAYVKKSSALTSVEKATADSWIAALYERYLDGEGYLVLNTSGEKPKPETATTAGRGMQNTKALAKTHTLTYQDMQVVQNNISFYNDILGSSSNYDFYYFTPGRIWDASGYYVTVIGDPIITADLNTYQMAEVVVTWVSKVNPLPYEFDTDTFLEGLYYIISFAGSGNTYLGNTITSGCNTTESSTFSAVLNIGPISGAPAQSWSIDEVAGSEPIVDILLEIDSVTGVLTWTPGTGSVNGTYIFTVTVTNEYGCVFGQETITLIVDCTA